MLCGCCGRFVGFGRSRSQHKKKGPGKNAEALCITELERSVLRCFRSFLRWLRIGSDRFRFGFATVEPAYGVSANRPRCDLRAFRFLALAVADFVGRADEAAFDEDVRTLLDRSHDVL